METLIGILLVVSGNKRKNKVNCKVARSIFELIKNFKNYDVSRKNYTFALSAKYGIFDVFKLIDLFDKEIDCCSYDNSSHVNNRTILVPWIVPTKDIILHDKPLLSGDEHWTVEMASYDKIVENIYQIVEQHGAPKTRYWMLKETIQSAIPYETAGLLLKALKSSMEFMSQFVIECLPFELRFLSQKEKNSGRVFDAIKNCFPFEASTGDISKIVVNAMLGGSVISVQRASEILHRFIDAKTLISDRINQLMVTKRSARVVRAHLYDALHKATEIFQKDEYLKHKKLFFVFSDWEPVYLSSVFERLKNLKVTVVCFLITRNKTVQPLRLYSCENSTWSNGTKTLFSWSSSIPLQLLPRSIFFERKWNIDITDNQTKLFLKINHHTDIHYACNLSRHVVICEELFSVRVLSRFDEKYINQSIYGFTAQEQVGGTCYANASATIIHLTTRRILGRKGGYPNFNDLREKIINLHGKNGAKTLNVLQKMCPEYRLRCKVIDLNNVISSLASNRPVVATFCLNDLEWAKFSQFFKHNRTGTLTKADIDIRDAGPGGKRSGHAVVVTSFNIRSLDLRILNSWGGEWADEGYFKVQNSQVLDFKFIAVYYTLKDLLPNEIKYYEKNKDYEILNDCRL
ncbi:Hypothetical predicted protein [Mytilus galloprovincialis]|uniref:Peptidase C1A papain C-terminal domain-containing protein n=1 Tax=Mytilus galloprovincialis TaxID=29158 RepID=A0A8B6GBJ5_MYTGA|nr:Hypothetical predicted protein [Mytilus galloprovincialis]